MTMTLKGTLLAALVVVALGYLALVFLVYLFQDHLLFFPQKRAFAECDLARMAGFETVDTRAGEQKVRLFVHEKPDARVWIIMFHGNGSTACDSIYYWDALRALPANFAFAEYPGYQGDESVRSSQPALLENATAIYDFIAARNRSRLPVVGFGESLGTGVVTYLATVREVRGLVLRTPYTSIADVGAGHYPFLPVRWLMRNPFPAAEWAPKVKGPVLILHGTRDDTIPLSNAREQAKRFQTAPTFVTIEGANHNDLSEVDPKLLFGSVRSFISGLLGEAPGK